MGKLDELLPGVDLCQLPMGVPPDGQSRDMEGDSSMKPITISICVITTTLALIPSSGRIYGNLRKLGWGDLFVVLASILAIAEAGTMIGFVKYFRHMWNMPLCWISEHYEEASYAWQICYMLGLFFAKSATLLLFFQLFNVSRPMRIAVWVGLGVNCLITVASIIILTYYTAPNVGQIWSNFQDILGSIVFPLYYAIVQSMVGTLLDVYIFILPLPVIYRLNLSWKKKMQLMGLFFVGFIGVVASIVSLVYRFKSVQGVNPDKTYNTAVLVNCNIVELNAALVVCSTPGFASFLRSGKNTWFSKKSSSSYGRSLSGGPGGYTDISGPRRDIPSSDREEGIELGDTWALRSGATVEIEAPKNVFTPNDQNIYGLRVDKTVDVEHSSRDLQS